MSICRSLDKLSKQKLGYKDDTKCPYDIVYDYNIRVEAAGGVMSSRDCFASYVNELIQ